MRMRSKKDVTPDFLYVGSDDVGRLVEDVLSVLYENTSKERLV